MGMEERHIYAEERLASGHSLREILIMICS